MFRLTELSNFSTTALTYSNMSCTYHYGRGGGGQLKKVNITHPKIPEIDLDFLRFFPAQCLFAPKAQKGITKG